MKFPPGPPEGLNADRVTRSDVTLSWRPPKDDGGSRIVGYVVEQRHKSESTFREVNSSFPHPHLSYTCTSLREHEEYCFRVSAVNDVGRGEPCKATSWIKVGEQANQPKIDLSCVKDIRVRAGDDFSVNINYAGFPKPTAQFWKDELQVHTDSRVHIQVTEDFVSIIVKASTREDAGHYRLKLTNDAGYDTASFRVTVLDRPAPPRNSTGRTLPARPSPSTGRSRWTTAAARSPTTSLREPRRAAPRGTRSAATSPTPTPG
jgi:hypothetical protein